MTTAFFAPDSGVNILLTIVVTLVFAVFAVFLIVRVRRDRLRADDISHDQENMTPEQFGDYVNRQIKSAGKHRIILLRVDVCDYESLYRAIGETQYENYVKEQIIRISKIQPWGLRIIKVSDDCLLISLRNADAVETDKICKLALQAAARTVSLSSDCTFASEVNVACAVYPDAGFDYSELYKNLDIAMLNAKRKGKDNYVVYSSTLSNVESREYKFYEEIQNAIKTKEFVLYYQPIVNVNSYEVTMGESLLRWDHKSKGVLLPSDFMYIMEKTGDIIWAGYWGFEELIKQFALWNENYEQKFLISHNLSDRQLQEPGLADQFKKLAFKHRTATKNLVLEITDISLYFTSATVKENIDKFSQYGFLIALDGFGGKFSSITDLENLPINIIKIDKSFWGKTDESHMTQNLLSALVSYSKEKSISLVAMRVDSKEEIDKLKDVGLEIMQGYLFGKPETAKEFIGDVVLTPWSDELK